jgi:FdhD protein
MLTTKAETVLRWETGSRGSRQRDQLAVEEPLEIQIDTRPVCVTMRTPGQDEELAAGFLLSEGLIHKRTDLSRIEPYPRNPTGNVVNVFLAPDVAVNFQQLTRHVFASSSCGLCGKATITAVHRHFKPIRARCSATAKTLLALPEQLRANQKTFEHTGGLHAAAIFDLRGQLIALREDIGRHNAVDKLLGFGLLNDLLPFDRHFLMVSGRASFEIMQKALAGRIPIVCAVSAPSSLAVAFARASNQTLVGFLRGQRMNVYCGAQRIKFRTPR